VCVCVRLDMRVHISKHYFMAVTKCLSY